MSFTGFGRIVVIFARTARSKPANDFNNSTRKTETTKNDHEPRSGVKPFIEEISNESTDNHRTKKSKRNVERDRRHSRDIPRVFLCAGRRRLLVL